MVEERLAFLMLLLIAVLAILSRQLRVPYPIVFVVAGVGLALIPGIPDIQLRPDLVFLIFLPPLIFGDGWKTDWRWFVRYIRPIFTLSTGLVVVTTVAVAFVANRAIGLPLPAGFVLGAILSPTDAVATDALAETGGLPRSLSTIISGESLVNDATGLIVYRFAVAAVLSGAFSLWVAVGEFVYVAVAGVAIGLGIAWVITHVVGALNRGGFLDDTIAVTFSLFTPYAVYVPADALGASGILAAMTAGIYMSNRTSRLFDAESRITSAGAWDLLFFLFNGVLFILTGLQLRQIVAHLGSYSPAWLAGAAAAIVLTVILVRLAWVFPVAWLRRRFDRNIEAREGRQPPAAWTFILAWAGTRGILSLAAALAVPRTLPDGTPFPGRDLILFATFAVILATLCIQGLSMPVLIRRFGVVDASENEVTAAARARATASSVALERLRALEPSFDSAAHWEIAGRLRSQYEERAAHAQAHADGAADGADRMRHGIERGLRGELYAAERRALEEMRRSGEITDDVFRALEWEIDLAQSGLES